MKRFILPICVVAVLSLATTGPATAQNFLMPSHVIGSGAANGTSTNFKLLGTVGQSAIGTGTSTNFKGSWGFWYTLGAGGSVILADLDAFLEGPYSGSAMTASLGSDIPTSQPFSGSPWNYSGSESVAGGFFGSNPTIVDWVFVQLRTGNPASPPMTVVGQRAGFIKTDGTIVDIDGSSALSFAGLPAGSYYVVVDHRNHLRVMSPSAVASASNTVTHNFTTGLAQAYPGSGNTQKSLAGGKYGLFAADGNADDDVTAPDFNLWNTQTTAGATGYQSGDYNIDGDVTAPDFNLYNANTTAGATSYVPTP